MVLSTLLAIALLGAIPANGQDEGGKPKSVEKQRKEFLDLQDQREKDADKALEEKRKRHLKVQTKETRKRMRKHKRYMRRLENNRHEKNFFERLFTRKRR